MRYTVTCGVDSMGSRYATGPLTFVETDELAKAQAWIRKNGRGEVLDHETKNAWSPGMGWYDVSAAYEELAARVR